MSQVIEILRSLGIDGTVYYQFGIFFIAFLGLKFIVFKPYLNAYDERIRRTVGGEEEAEKLLAEADDVERQYKEAAKKLNGEINSIFADQNSKAKKEIEQIMAVAKKEADAETEQARKELEDSIASARREMESHIPSISENIARKFVGN